MEMLSFLYYYWLPPTCLHAVVLEDLIFITLSRRIFKHDGLITFLEQWWITILLVSDSNSCPQLYSSDRIVAVAVESETVHLDIIFKRHVAYRLVTRGHVVVTSRGDMLGETTPPEDTFRLRGTHVTREE